MMMESRNFLVPDATFAIEMVAFLVMTRFVVPRIRAGMQARQDAINQALAAARDAEVRRATAEAQSEAIRATARREARTIIEQARRMRDQMIADGRRAGIEEYRWESARTERELQRRLATASPTGD
jgi:F-type H+-transporting ATPase subunit b